MAKVESFTLDHTAVKAPYVRLITVETGAKGDKISNFDLRFVQPNEMQFQQPDCIQLNICWQDICVTIWMELLIAHLLDVVQVSI